MASPRARRALVLLVLGVLLIGGLFALEIGPKQTVALPAHLSDPALAHLGDGVILASWDARPSSAKDSPNPNSIVQRRSTNNGATWGPQTVIAAGRTSKPQHRYSDPSYVVDRETGTVFTFFVYSHDTGFFDSAWGNRDSDRDVMSSAVVHSDDAGLTWSEPRLITSVTKPATGGSAPKAGDVRATFATSGEGIQLRFGPNVGRLIQQYAGVVRQPDGTDTTQAYSVFSDDHGETWQRGEFVGVGMDENKTVELSDGRVMLNSRSGAADLWRSVAVSDDGGVSYGPVAGEPQLADPINNASLTRMFPDAEAGSPDAKKLLFTNANNGANRDRVNGAARVSCDDGATWPGLRTIDTGAFAYSSATRIDDGLFGVLWERSSVNDLQFTTFDDAWLNYVCAPLTVTPQFALPSHTSSVPVAITNQESVPLSGEVTFFAPAGWKAGTADIRDLEPGETVTVRVPVTAPAGTMGTHRVQAAFTAADGRMSQFTARLTAGFAR
ncbi:MAG: exo-alpha-sialidase [Actinomycetales bacterium]|nr:exo-alpha-sialidase [Actinomycetales bacterium]